MLKFCYCETLHHNVQHRSNQYFSRCVYYAQISVEKDRIIVTNTLYTNVASLRKKLSKQIRSNRVWITLNKVNTKDC